MNSETQSELNRLHERAMALVADAAIAKKKGDSDRAHLLRMAALDHESRVASRLMPHFDLEPSRGIIFRSAASIAIECNLFDEAERLAAQGLAGAPSREIAEQLRELLFDVQFRRHLHGPKVASESDRLHVSLTGPAITPDAIEPDLLYGHVETLHNLMVRTQEKLLGNPFRGAVRRPAALRELYPVLYKPAGNGAFGFDLIARVGQRRLSIMEDSEENVVDATMNVLSSVTSGDRQWLNAFCGNDPSYYRYFVATTKGLVPDGTRVKHLGVAKRDTVLKQIVMSPTTRETIVKRMVDPVSRPDRIVERGILSAADQTSGTRATIRIRDEAANSHQTFEVPTGITAEFLSKYWGQRVVATGELQRRSPYPLLSNLDPEDDE